MIRSRIGSRYHEKAQNEDTKRHKENPVETSSDLEKWAKSDLEKVGFIKSDLIKTKPDSGRCAFCEFCASCG